MTQPFAPSTSISYKTGIFSTIRWRFRHIFDVLCTIFIWPCDLDLRPFDLGGVWRIKSLIGPTHLQILSILRLSIPELCVTQSYHITITWNAVTAHAPYHVTCHRGSSEMTYIVSSGALNSTHSLTGPKKPHVTIFWPRLMYSLYNFYGATITIKGSFILEHPHVKAIFGHKKVSSQNRSPKW